MFELTLSHHAAKSLDKIPDSLAKKIVSEIQKLGENPFPGNSKKLQGQDNYRLRVGSYRAIYTLDKKSKIITILRVADRKEIYR